MQPTSPDISQSAVALSETGGAVAWPSLGAAKETSRKKTSVSAPTTPVARKVGDPSVRAVDIVCRFQNANVPCSLTIVSETNFRPCV